MFSKAKMSWIAGLMLISSLAQAQGGTSSTSTQGYFSRPVATSGIRVGVFMPILEFETKLEWGGFRTSSNEQRIDRTAGVSVGYAHFPVGVVGFSGDFALMEMYEKNNGNDATVTLARLDGNVGYAVNEIFYFKGGANLSGFTQSAIRDELKPSVGLQTYAGFQLNEHFGAEVGYVYMSQRGEEDTSIGKVEVTTIERGLEFRLNGTF